MAFDDDTRHSENAPVIAPHPILTVRLNDLRAQIDQVCQTIQRFEELDADLFARVGDRLQEGLDDCQRTFDAVEASIGQDTEWKELAKAQSAVKALGQEALAYSQGALTRRYSPDGRFCELADGLLDYFGNVEPKLNWRGFTILSDTAYLGDMAEVIRLKYPGVDYWHLAVAAHEFGHFANPNIRAKEHHGSFKGWTYPVEDFLRVRWSDNDQRKWFYAHEHFADIFATFSLGPAYAYHVLFLEVSPRTLRSATTTHPSWNDRFSVMLETLERMVMWGGVTPQLVTDLRHRWQNTLSVSAGDKPADLEALGAYVDFLLPLLEAHLKGLRYTTIRHAQQLVAHLRGKGPALTCEPPDILNASWLARLYDLADDEAAGEIADRATGLLEGSDEQ